jgi:hypothetical protein
LHDEQINMRPPLVRLAGLMDWEQIERHFASHVTLGRGRPALAPRLAAGLLDRFAPVAAMQRLLPVKRTSQSTAPNCIGAIRRASIDKSLGSYPQSSKSWCIQTSFAASDTSHHTWLNTVSGWVDHILCIL